MHKVKVKCRFCQNNFEVTLKRYNSYTKYKCNFYCSKECRTKSRIKATKTNCVTCGKEVVVTPCEIKQSKSGNFFCNSSCAAIFNGKNRKHTEKTKEKIRNSIIKYCKKNNKRISPIKNCILCGRQFRCEKDNIKCCSRQCGQIYKFGSLPHTRDEVVNTIMSLSQKLNRTPQQRDCVEGKLLSAAIRFFGSWNKAMEHCGLKPNSTMLHRMKLKCKDGHIAESISEKIVDEWLFKNGIAHERTKKYPGDKRFNCDFYLNDFNIWLEYFGMINNVEEYDAVVSIKRQIAKDNHLNFIEIIPSDLYPKNKLDSFLPRIKGGQEVVKQEGLFDNV